MAPEYFLLASLKRPKAGQKCWPAHELRRPPGFLFGYQHRDSLWPARVRPSDGACM